MFFFQLSVNLSTLYKKWIDSDPYFANLISSSNQFYEGIRVLSQDPFETMFSFICSSNNNIRRISSMYVLVLNF